MPPTTAPSEIVDFTSRVSLPVWGQLIAMILTLVAGGFGKQLLDYLREGRKAKLDAAVSEQTAQVRLREELFEIINQQQIEISTLRSRLDAHDATVARANEAAAKAREESIRLAKENTALNERCRTLELEVSELRRRLSMDERVIKNLTDPPPPAVQT